MSYNIAALLVLTEKILFVFVISKVVERYRPLYLMYTIEF